MKTILVVEDEAAVAALLRMILEDAGYRVRVAANGREALARLREERPDLVLSDVMMPILDGHGLYAALKSEPDHCSIPIMLMSAAGPRVLQAEEQPAAFVAKPFDVDHLLSTVSDVLDP